MRPAGYRGVFAAATGAFFVFGLLVAPDHPALSAADNDCILDNCADKAAPESKTVSKPKPAEAKPGSADDAEPPEPVAERDGARPEPAGRFRLLCVVAVLVAGLLRHEQRQKLFAMRDWFQSRLRRAWPLAAI